MKHLRPSSLAIVSILALSAACGGGGESSGGGGHAGSTGTSSSSSSTSSTSSGGTSSSSSSSSSTSSGGTSSSSSSSGSSGAVADPAFDGPYQITELDDVIASVPGGDTNQAVHCAHPVSGPSSGPFPVVVIGHGMQLPPSQYVSYVKRLATFGYVALTVDFSASLLGVDNTKGAKDMLAGIDWAKNKAGLNADASTAGMSGHSLGGKTALLAATLDARVKAAFTMDPVDGGGPTGCSGTCVDVSTLMPNLHIPTGFIGETTDASGGFQPCAPAADNFLTFYAGTSAPSLAVTAAGANHMSFLDNVSTCGFTCSFCNAATAPNAQVNGMAKAFMVAFYERYLRGNTGYDAYLTGNQAHGRYVSTGQATIASK